MGPADTGLSGDTLVPIREMSSSYDITRMACRDVESEQVCIKLEKARARMGTLLANIPTGRTYDFVPNEPVYDGILVRPPANLEYVRNDQPTVRKDEELRGRGSEQTSGLILNDESKDGIEMKTASQPRTLKSMCMSTVDQLSESTGRSKSKDEKAIIDVSHKSETLSTFPFTTSDSVVSSSTPPQSPKAALNDISSKDGTMKTPEHTRKPHYVTLKPELVREDRAQRADHLSLNEFLVAELEVYCSQLLERGYPKRESSGARDLARVTGLQLYQDHQRALLDFDDEWKRSHADRRPSPMASRELQKVSTVMSVNPFQLTTADSENLNEWTTLLTQVKTFQSKRIPAGKSNVSEMVGAEGREDLLNLYKRGSNGFIISQDDCFNERVQASAFMAQIASNQHTSALYIVVAASSDLASWEKALSSEHLIQCYPYWGSKQDRQNLLQSLSNEYFSRRKLVAHVLLACYEVFLEDLPIVTPLQCLLSIIDIPRQSNDQISAIWPQLLSLRCRQRLLLCHSSYNIDARKLLHFLVPELFSSRRKLLAWNSAAFYPHHINAICNALKAFVLISNEETCSVFISNVEMCTKQNSEIEMAAMDTLYKQGIVRAMEPSILVPVKRVRNRKSRSRPSGHIPAQGKLELPDSSTNRVDSQLVIKTPNVISKNRRGSDSTAGSRQRIGRCGKCSGCLTEDCMKCGHCQDMKKYGGPGLRKQSCKNRKCLNPKIWGYATRKRKRRKTKRAGSGGTSRVKGDPEADDDGSVAYSSVESDGESVSAATNGNGDSGDESLRYSDAPIDSPRDLLLPASDTLLDDNLSLGDLSSRSASAKSRVVRCGECEGCNAPDCMQCPHCLDMKKYGGPGLRKQTCKNRKCNAPKILMLNKAKGGDDQYVDEKGNVVESGQKGSFPGLEQAPDSTNNAKSAFYNTPSHSSELSVIQDCERYVKPQQAFACVACAARFSSNRVLSFHTRVEHAMSTSQGNLVTAAWEREASRLLARPMYQLALMSAEIQQQGRSLQPLPLGYAKLEGRGFQYFFIEPFIILGRMETKWCNLYEELGYRNHKGLPGGVVDCHVGNDDAIASRHAVISWDALANSFAIECLSFHTPILVNGQEVEFSSAPTLLSSRSTIQIGASAFYFLLPTAMKASRHD